MFTTSLERGVIKHTDSPLLRAIIHGRVIIIDEADKAPEHVVAIFRSLAGQGEMTLSDGRRVRKVKGREGDIVVHPKFRLVLLANRPGYRESNSVSPLAFRISSLITSAQRSWGIISCKCWVTISVGEQHLFPLGDRER